MIVPRSLKIDSAHAAVRIEGVAKAYRRGASSTAVLDQVSLSIDRGECAFLVGPSGSGKTTLLSILGCILTADRGTVRIFGQETTAMNPARRAALRLAEIGFVFQRFHLIRGLSASANVAVPLALRGVAPKVARRRAVELLEEVGLGDKIDAHPNNLSAGQCQRVALARALAGEPRLILADEPTASLDAANGADVMALLQKLAKKDGRTVIVVTHDARIFSFADRIFRVDSGRATEDASPYDQCSLAKAG
ncbi:MAG: ABC transporter ATP-binding protein [Pirellulales bacterium]|nr:ABC transporter ATP-binding protein [Pirellulales bacterium]